jgi:hypothetical protein
MFRHVQTRWCTVFVLTPRFKQAAINRESSSKSGDMCDGVEPQRNLFKQAPLKNSLQFL